MSDNKIGAPAASSELLHFRDLIFDAPGFFRALAQGITNLGKDKPVQLPKIVVDSLTSLPLQSLTPEMRAHVLAYRALLRGTALLIATTLRDLTLSSNLEDSIPDESIIIPARFFYNPQQFPQDFPVELSGYLAQWLIASGLESSRANTIAVRLPGFFILGLHEEWSAQPDAYESLVPYFDNPFNPAIESELAWQRYHIGLYYRINERVMREPGGIAPAYIQPRAYWLGKPEVPGEKIIRHVVDLHAQMNEWFNRWDRTDPIRFLIADWGMGKSAFIKMWAAGLVERGSHHILFVPSKTSPPFEVGIDIDKENIWAEDWHGQLERYISEVCHLTQHPFHPTNDGIPVLLIFDGFDGFSFGRQVIPEHLQGFINEIIDVLHTRNKQKCEVMAVIVGRALSPYIQNSAQALYLLPYKIESTQDAEDTEPYEYEGPASLLEIDQRDLWWQKRGALTGKNYAGMPAVLRRELGPSTSRPISNRQAASYFEAGRVDPEGSFDWKDWDTYTFGDTTYANNADFSYCNLSGEFLYGAELANANFTCANLSHAWLMWADLSGANLTGADFTGAGLEGANLTNAIVVDVRVGSLMVNDAESLLAFCSKERFRSQHPD